MAYSSGGLFENGGVNMLSRTTRENEDEMLGRCDDGLLFKVFHDLA